MAFLSNEESTPESRSAAAGGIVATAADNAGGVAVCTDKEHCPSPHSFRNKVGRVVWGLVWVLLFRPSPRICFAWRRGLLRLCGARIGRQARIFPSVRIWAPWNLTVGDEVSLARDVDCYCVAPITIGSYATISQEAFLCAATHDPRSKTMVLVSAPIAIGSQAWVCARAFVGPGVTIGDGAVLGACAVTTKDVAAWTIAAGNPARFIRQRTVDRE